MLQVQLPSAIIGTPYKECVEITGTLPITVVKHNLGDDGEVEMFGNLMCVTIPSPSGSIDLAVELQGACTTCKPVVVTSSITASAASGGCACTPVSFKWQPLPDIKVGDYVDLAITVNGSMPFEVCGGAAAKCLTIKLDGNIVSIRGNYEAEGPIMFSIKNACSCDCVTWDYKEGGQVGLPNVPIGGNLYGFGCDRPSSASVMMDKCQTSNACSDETDCGVWIYPTPQAGTEVVTDCNGQILGYAVKK